MGSGGVLRYDPLSPSSYLLFLSLHLSTFCLRRLMCIFLPWQLKSYWSAIYFCFISYLSILNMLLFSFPSFTPLSHSLHCVTCEVQCFIYLTYFTD
jgi:hypothetical protein